MISALWSGVLQKHLLHRQSFKANFLKTIAKVIKMGPSVWLFFISDSVRSPEFNSKYFFIVGNIYRAPYGPGLERFEGLTLAWTCILKWQETCDIFESFSNHWWLILYSSWRLWRLDSFDFSMYRAIRFRSGSISERKASFVIVWSLID